LSASPALAALHSCPRRLARRIAHMCLHTPKAAAQEVHLWCCLPRLTMPVEDGQLCHGISSDYPADAACNISTRLSYCKSTRLTHCRSTTGLLQLFAEVRNSLQVPVRPLCHGISASSLQPMAGTTSCMPCCAPLRPESPKLLPHVHLLWAPLIAALCNARPPVVERGLALLAQTAALSGQFLARRCAASDRGQGLVVHCLARL
jgi:hypothetical protein